MRLAPATVCVSAASFLAERGGKSVRERWKFIARSFRAPPPRWCRRYVEAKFQTLNDDQIKRNTPTAAHTTIHATCQKKKEKRNSQAKSCKERKKAEKKKNKNHFHETHLKAANFCFIYSPSVDEVGSAFSCARSVEVSKQENETKWLWWFGALQMKIMR